MYNFIRFGQGIALFWGGCLATLFCVVVLLQINRQKSDLVNVLIQGLLWPFLKVLSLLGFNGAVDRILRQTAVSNPLPAPVSENTNIEERRFRTEREAKQYLVAQIEAEAARRDIALTDIECKMLYFSETGWTLPGILKVNEEFERDYDEAAYEAKISSLVESIERRNTAAGGQAQSDWSNAIVTLSQGDHYLLVLLNLQKPQRTSNPWLPQSPEQLQRYGRPDGDFVRMLLAGFVLIFFFLFLGWLRFILDR